MTDRGVLVIGVGNELRGDDRAGIEVARRVARAGVAPGIAVRECQAEPIMLLEQWSGARGAVLVDTMRSGAAPGTVRRFDVSRRPLPAQLGGPSSTHAIGLGEAIELGRGLGRLPERVIVYAVEGSSFAAGDPLSDELAARLPGLIDAVLDAATEILACA